MSVATGAAQARRRRPIHIIPPSVERILAEWVSRHTAPSVLEAGCGSTSHFQLPPDAHLVGVDISPSQLLRHGSLDSAIEGDIQDHDFEGETFDLVICWNVLEHVPRPADAFRNLAGTLSEGGLLVIGVPHLWSVKGVVTRLTPFSVHRAFYRMMGDRSVGSEEFGQFPTVMARDVEPWRLKAMAEQEGLEVLLSLEYEGPVQSDLRSRTWIADQLFALASGVARPLTRGRYDPAASEYVLIARRRSPNDGVEG